MAIVNGYATLAALRQRIELDDPADTQDDASMERSIAAASRNIDAYCGQRFWLTSPAEPKSFVMPWRLYLDLPPMAEPPTLVELDGNVLVAGTDYEVTKTKEEAERPYNMIHFRRLHPRLRAFPNKRLTITAKWGWAAIPEPISEACLLLAAHHFALRNVPLGEAGGTETVSVGSVPSAQRLLVGYRRVQSIG